MNTSLFRILGCLFVVFGGLSVQGQHYSEELTAYQHLYEVNKEWKHLKNITPTEKKRFSSDTKRIRFHLESVISHLLKVEPTSTSIAIQEKRKDLLTRLQAYAKREIFPQNIHHKHRQPYFIDHKGTHCAVGYMMKVSGSAALAQEISQEHNYDYLADIKTEGVLDWAAAHGFLLQELALIQPGYITNKPFETLEKGTNGPVNVMFQRLGKLYVAGDFDLLDSLPCLNIGVYEMGQLSCLGTGLDGKINAVNYDPYTQSLIVVGDLINGGNHYPIARYDVVNGWSFQNISNRPNVEGLHLTTGYITSIVIKSPNIVGTEIWKSTAGAAFGLNYTFHGTISDIADSWYVGFFDSVTLHQQGIPDTVFYSHNVISLFNNNVLSSFSVADAALLPDTITAVVTLGNITYLGGYSSNPIKPSVTRFLNNTLQPLLFEYDLTGSWINAEVPKVLEMVLDYNSWNLYIVGDINHNPSNGYSWTSIAEYHVGIGALTGYNHFDSSITSVTVFEGDLIVGGPFTSLGTQWGIQKPLNHLARLSVPTSTTKIDGEFAFKLFPNPATDRVTVDLGNEDLDVRIEIYNALGQIVYQQEHQSTNRVDLPLEGASGVYLVKVRTVDSESIVKVVKQ